MYGERGNPNFITGLGPQTSNHAQPIVVPENRGFPSEEFLLMIPSLGVQLRNYELLMLHCIALFILFYKGVDCRVCFFFL